MDKEGVIGIRYWGCTVVRGCVTETFWRNLPFLFLNGCGKERKGFRETEREDLLPESSFSLNLNSSIPERFKTVLFFLFPAFPFLQSLLQPIAPPAKSLQTVELLTTHFTSNWNLYLEYKTRTLETYTNTQTYPLTFP